MRWRRSLTLPRRGDLVAGLSVALVLIPQSLAYAELAGLPAVHGLYAAAVAPLAAALIGSSPYLQTGPVALTSLLTLSALAPLAETGTAGFAAHAALLAIVVGVVRLLFGLLRWGAVSYLLSQPVVSAFTVAAAILIIASQVPTLVDGDAGAANPFLGAAQALGAPGAWDAVAVGIGVATVLVVLAGRRISPLFPAVLLATVGALLLSAFDVVAVPVVGAIPAGLPPLDLGLPWEALPSLVVPGVVIALVGFAEPSSIARRYASMDRTPWNPNREFTGQGLANIVAGLFSGLPAGGSFSRSALNRLSGGRTRWSGAVTGLVVLAVLPAAGVLADLPTAVLAGLVIAAALSLLEVRPFTQAWRCSRPQFAIAVLTFVITLAAAPRVEWGIVAGVVLSLAVHLWREMRLDVTATHTGTTLHVWLSGVLYFASAPVLEGRLLALLAEQPDVYRVMVHLQGLGRVDLTGLLSLRSVIEHTRESGTEIELCDIPDHVAERAERVLGDLIRS
ncbi:SulP family inorganic anion transporter [Haloechinothrix sp. YIM 98757]|uniref:SulP family inorganic anion transporter n=1 Tax=Haloechinothrix aidingensis TaxID=2752311 RepID=A0A838ABL7_9PSEU|nr:SulP family inorganic anion transporter [Haloechinothrix aidingensis]